MKLVRAVCPHDCPDTCAMLVEIDENGRAVRVKGDPSNPYTHGGLCVKVAHYEKRTYHADRLLANATVTEFIPQLVYRATKEDILRGGGGVEAIPQAA